jgi:hypothetical protein
MEPNEALEKVREVVKRLQREYADDPNVKAVGWGLARRGGELAGGISILFYVRKKLPSARAIEAHGSRMIPAEIDGFPTDVVADSSRPAQAAGARDDTKYDPLRGGVATSNSEGHLVWFNGFGTLGILARDNATNAPVALSNWHVWGDGGSAGDQIIQPGHPTAGDHVEAVGKVLACGPLVTSLIEWEAPDPIAAGLYAGAAAAAIAAACSDQRDPTRRGQDATPVGPGELTESEAVEVDIEYPQLPLPGVAFQANVTWSYERRTNEGVHAFQVDETRVNTQFLLGKMIRTNKPSYAPGEVVELVAAVWDYQPRPCDGYHVVAHLIPHRAPTTAVRAVLHPTACPRTFPQDPPEEPGQKVCVVFDDQPLGEHPYKGSFEWLQYLEPSQDGVRIVDWYAPAQGLLIPPRLLLTHEPAGAASATIVHFHDPVHLTAYNAAGAVVGSVTSPATQGVEHTLEVRGDGIVRVLIHGGGGEGLLLRYCIEPAREGSFAIGVGPSLAESIRFEQPTLALTSSALRAKRCCFRGSFRLPPDEPAGKWDVHLTVQNVNQVPEGTPPEQAATIIGGHVLSSHTSAEILGCTAIMLFDHVFDVF